MGLINEAKQQRRDILAKIDVLEKQRCSKCIGSASNSGEMNCQCKVAAEIRMLGAEYEAIATASRADRINVLIDELKREGLSVEVYRKLRENDLTDLAIFTQAGIPKKQFVEWKAAMQLTRTYQSEKAASTEKEKSPRTSVMFEQFGIRDDDFQVAYRNGINYNAIISRLKCGWSVQRAITEPIIQRKNDFKKWEPIAERNGIKVHALRRRVQRGEPIESAATRPPRKKAQAK